MVLSFSTFYFSHKQKQNIVSNEKAIVFSSKVTVKSTPAKSGTDLFVIHEGLKVKILREVGDWYEIKLADGNVGWIQKEDVEEI
jgi:SH3-like domain-containing protein